MVYYGNRSGFVDKVGHRKQKKYSQMETNTSSKRDGKSLSVDRYTFIE